MNDELLQAVGALAAGVGAAQIEDFRSLPPGGGDEKAAREFVSQVDVRSEQLLIEGLRTLLPEAGFFGEESGRQGSETLRWIIDPLDGTTNFLSGLDQFSISVALEREGRIDLGIVYRPASEELFCARRGRGLLRNGRSLPRIDPRLPLSRALIGTGFPYRSRDLSAAFFPCAEKVLYASRGIRRMGSAALDLSYVAAGFLQGFWESDLQPYDVAAALLFLEEQGCVVSNERGDPYRMGQDRLLVCGWPGVHCELLEVVSRHYQG